MSVHHIECAALTSLPAARKLVLMALCDSADKVTGIAYPGMDTLRSWSNLQQSQVMAHLAALIEDGYLERVSRARPGRRAVFRVFARVACCPLHEPFAVLDGSAPPEVNGSAGPEQNGSGGPENRSNGSSNGSGNGSGLGRKPSVSSVSPPMESYVETSPRRATPEPPSNIERSNDDTRTQPDRCPRHQDDINPPPCGGCKGAREHHERTTAETRRARNETERRRRAEQRELRRLDIAACGMCDDDGRDATGMPCTHDPDNAERARQGLAKVRAILERSAS